MGNCISVPVTTKVVNKPDLVSDAEKTDQKPPLEDEERRRLQLELAHFSRGFEALSICVDVAVNKLDAFETPKLKRTINSLENRLETKNKQLGWSIYHMKLLKR